MNSFDGNITHIQTHGNLSIVTVCLYDNTFIKSIVIDTPETAHYFIEGKSVQVFFKETEVIISTSKELEISLQNKLVGNISSIEKGILLSRIEINTTVGKVTSIISTQEAEQLQLAEGTDVLVMIKLNEVILST